MKALGLIETRGLLAAIESSDAMLKAAEVNLVEKSIVGGGIVTITIIGDVASVAAAVEAGAAAVQRLSSGLLLSQHVIPRPADELTDMIDFNPFENKAGELVFTQEESPIQESTILTEEKAIQVEKQHKKDLDEQVKKEGIEKVIDYLETLKVVEIRRLAREYEDFDIKGRAISDANKETLIKAFGTYYKRV